MGRIPPPPRYEKLTPDDPGPIDTEPMWQHSDSVIGVAVSLAVVTFIVGLVFLIFLWVGPSAEYQQCRSDATDAWIANGGTPSETWDYSYIVCRRLR